MKIRELFDAVNAWAELKSDRTCDTFKSGDPSQEITGVAVSMFATPDVIRACAEKGINLLIVHEPTYYNHWDDHIPFAIGEEKRALLEKCGVTVFRFHDHAHSMSPDMIFEGEMHYLGLAGHAEPSGRYAITHYVLDEPMTAKQLAARIEEKLGVHHVKIAGCADKPGTKLSCSFGTPGHTAEELTVSDFVLTGEICEWAEGQMARDYAQLGYNKAILVLGHIGSERDGMRLMVEKLRAQWPELPVEYIECGETYTYTDSER